MLTIRGVVAGPPDLQRTDQGIVAMTRSRAAVAEARFYAFNWRSAAHDCAVLARQMCERAVGSRTNAGAFAAAISFLVIAAGAALHLTHEHGRALAVASHELALEAGEIAQRVDAKLAAQPATKLSDALPSSVIEDSDFPSAVALIADERGVVIGARPTALGPDATIAKLISAAANPSPEPGLAGAVAFESAASGPMMAALRPLKAARGQVLLIAPRSEALAGWRDRAQLVVALVAFCGAVLGGAVALTQWQSRRARLNVFRETVRRSQLELALSRGRCGLWNWDLENGRATWSRSMFDILGLPYRSSLGVDDIEALMHPDDRPMFRSIEDVCADGGDSVDIEFRMRARDGQWVWLSQRAAIVEDEMIGCRRLVGVALDISERKREAEVSATADLRLREAIEAISEAFVLWDSSNRLVMCNSKYQRLHALPAEAARPGMSYGEIVTRAASPVVSAEAPIYPREPALGAERARTYEARLADGRWLQVNERRTRDGGFVSVGTDITALKEHEEQLIKSERLLLSTVAQLRQSRRSLESQASQLSELAQRYQEQKSAAEAANLAKAEFLANMGHELRTPLNAIIGFSQIMEAETFGPIGSSKYKEYCAHILTSGQNLLSVFSDVLDMSRLEAGRIQLNYAKFPVETAIGVAAQDVAPTARDKKIKLNVEVDAAEMLNADRLAVERVLTTLMRNAVKFSPDGGVVTVGAQTFKDHVYLYVEDDGPGIAEEDIARIGRPFVQASVAMANGMKGSGLGLAIAKSYVELHGGALRITSKLGEGTVVLVTLPKRVPSARVLALAAVA